LFTSDVCKEFDNIATDSRRKCIEDLPYFIEKHFKDISIILKYLDSLEKDMVLTIYHEKFVNNPKFHLDEICKFLGVSTDDNYLNACSSIVRKKEHKSRYRVNWTKSQLEMVETGISQFEILHGYSYYD